MKYDYRCKSCGHSFSLSFKFDTKITRGRHVSARCPICKSSKVRKLLSPVAIHYKGKGFYSTDNKNGDKK